MNYKVEGIDFSEIFVFYIKMMFVCIFFIVVVEMKKIGGSFGRFGRR